MPETRQHFSPVFLWFAGAYQIFEQMTSFFLLFFTALFQIVFGRLRRGYGAPGEKPIHLWQVERVVLNALAK